MSHSSSSSSSPTPPLPNTVSPAIPSTAFPMVPALDRRRSSSPSAKGTPNQQSVDLPRAQPQQNDRAGCWTCRIRRKRCDLERLEGNSCRTCKRLTIECLGWGARRPEWMRNKQAVDEYKASIKAQLTRKGLIRGQPRSSMLQAQAGHSAGTSRSATAATRSRTTRGSTSAVSVSPTTSPTLNGDYTPQPFQQQQQHHHHHQLYDPGPSTYNDLNGLDLNTSYFQNSPQLAPVQLSFTSTQSSPELQYNPTTTLGGGGTTTTTATTNTTTAATLNPNQTLFIGTGYDFGAPEPQPEIPILSGQNSIQESHVMYYFENIRRVHSLLSNSTVMNTTFELIVQDPRGALTNAVCALASLHYTRMRVAQGLEAPDPNPEHSTAKYFYDESYFQLINAKQLRPGGAYTETDVLAALHLVCFSQLSGGTTDWAPCLGIALDWIGGLGLPGDENPGITMSMMNLAGQLGVKMTMMTDIVSSLTLMRPPKYFALYQRLLSWNDNPNNLLLQPGGMQMEMLTGCPDDALLAIAEVSCLAYWKATEERKGTLSLRELIRRGDDIERRLRNLSGHGRVGAEGGMASQQQQQPQASFMASVEATFPSEDVRRVLGSIFRETGLLYLHTILNGAGPAVPEISTSVDSIVNFLRQLTPSDIDRSLIFPICLAGCMTDSSLHREFLKGRLQAQDETIGNIMKTRFLMEGVWQRRDVGGGTVDWREMIRERGLNLLFM
ncbi:c6 transcription [Moniliophthora roreri MCA 2997]|uniref:C6 transcription n=2 Tax=Moniliophthora roreri TaxID=221103 RepID=V2XNE9_MONRO|nr:c6 transcription [Moniliophthora roreri MCA 2997]KAI3607533.1 c6 transcription [Moniliophthora roreri]